MKIPVFIDKYTDYAVVMNEDGEFRCPHENVEVEYEQGGDGYTEPAGGWSVYCYDCHNDDMHDFEADNLVEAHNERDEDWEYEQYRDSQLERGA